MATAIVADSFDSKARHWLELIGVCRDGCCVLPQFASELVLRNTLSGRGGGALKLFTILEAVHDLAAGA